jgi:hypothetical protein
MVEEAVVSRRLVITAMLLSCSALGAVGAGAPQSAGVPALVAHEWGTFTSIAGADGHAVSWLPQIGSADLPGFVDRAVCGVKGLLTGLVRMETPVIYFYAPREMSVDVRVHFRQGVITEWFPRPASVRRQSTLDEAFRGRLAWTNVSVKPGAAARFPVDSTASHYYIGRETDASPIQMGSEQERFLFYRGVGQLPPPIAVAVSADSRLVVTNTRGQPLGDVVLFEHRDGAMAFEARRSRSTRELFTLPATEEGNVGPPTGYLEDVLASHGLYAKEAKAMVESWRDSWFEMGTRLFYILSGPDVDHIVPLQFDPRPDEVRRVFVGRIEIPTAATLRDVRHALLTGDRATLAQYGRFLDAFASQLASSLPAEERAVLRERARAAAASLAAASGCAPISR